MDRAGFVSGRRVLPVFLMGAWFVRASVCAAAAALAALSAKGVLRLSSNEDSSTMLMTSG